MVESPVGGRTSTSDEPLQNLVRRAECLQAGIAACHCAAKDYESTDWQQILALYDAWVELDASPVVALNRAIVVANLAGPRAGLDTVAAIEGREKLECYYLLYAVLGEFEAQLHNLTAAAGHFRKSLELAPSNQNEHSCPNDFAAAARAQARITQKMSPKAAAGERR
ncbi:hypothetical protein SBV1_310020 [Verrucomicrobia bacterium]|nr:hypothetical protein SBV1_310020 [Verrucomicrobiota bacterium]